MASEKILVRKSQLPIHWDFISTSKLGGSIFIISCTPRVASSLWYYYKTSELRVLERLVSEVYCTKDSAAGTKIYTPFGLPNSSASLVAPIL